MERKHGSYLVTMTCIIIIFIDALSFLAFVVQSIVVGGNNSGDASWLFVNGRMGKDHSSFEDLLMIHHYITAITETPELLLLKVKSSVQSCWGHYLLSMYILEVS